MATVAVEAPDLEKVNQNLVRQLNGTRKQVWGLREENAELTLRLERSIRKSKRRRKAIKGLEVALLRERAGK